MEKRLLIVDDNAQFARTVARLAAPLGFIAEQCSDPNRALDAFLAFKPDVMMIDMCMPEKDGVEVADEVLLTGIPVGIIFASGYGSAYLSMARGVAEYHDNKNVALLGKPFRRHELAEVLQGVCDAAEAQRIAMEARELPGQ